MDIRFKHNFAQLQKHFEMHPLFKAEDGGIKQPDKGIQQSYKNVANNSANVMFRAKIKGHTELDGDIPLHMTLKTFDKPEHMPTEEVHKKVKELAIQRPDPHVLQYEPVEFKSPKSGNTYYMLNVKGTDSAYGKFNDHFKGQGITHDDFMAHVTINKDLYDKIKKEGLHPHEVEFSPLMIEHGADKPTHIYQDAQSHRDKASDITPKKVNAAPAVPTKLAASEPDMDGLQKGAFKNAIAGVAATAAMTTAIPNLSAAVDHDPKAGSHKIEATKPVANKYDRTKMLRAIASVESNNGLNQDHKMLTGMHSGEKAFGKYGLTPTVIRETIKMNRDLNSKYGKATKLQGQDIHNFMHDNPGLEDAVANKHLSRLEHHFGNDPSKIGYAWLNGVSGTYKAGKENKDISKHWHVKKVTDAYAKPDATQASN